MKRNLVILAIAAVLAVATAVHGEDQHVKADLIPANGSGVRGFVQITQLPHGGSNVHVQVLGLHPGTTYASFYYESRDCTEPADLLQTFTPDANGNGQANGKIDDDVDEVGSVSVRIGPGYGTLQACATIH